VPSSLTSDFFKVDLESTVLTMSPLNRFIKLEDDITREYKPIAMADQAMHSTAAENKKLLPSVRGKRPPG
jgi:hypothetical protein